MDVCTVPITSKKEGEYWNKKERKERMRNKREREKKKTKRDMYVGRKQNKRGFGSIICRLVGFARCRLD